eukprot:TRINITY_DN9638_c0_g1_i3.p1 TRINITY_DN9638_c0_g1~~TRINITY_DN9638_c0_g1_i3.p1  ORF type:complete len:196 (-),score=20.05 TRINITY_DN9638_c0_g1_i3:16-558(-)
MSSDQFQFPDYYHLPPFFTLQPVQATRNKQVGMWVDFIISYLKAHQKSVVNLNNDIHTELFHNRQIDRKLSLAAAQTILQELVDRGYGIWDGAEKSRCLVSWRRLQDWAAALHHWASESGKLNFICTVFELRAGDETRGEEFYGLDVELFVRILALLEQQHKATLFRTNDNLDEIGVKFL